MQHGTSVSIIILQNDNNYHRGSGAIRKNNFENNEQFLIIRQTDEIVTK